MLGGYSGGARTIARAATLLMVAAALSWAISACDSAGPPKTATVRGTLVDVSPTVPGRPDTGTVQVSLFVAWDSTKGLASEASGGPPAFFSDTIPQGATEFVIENVTFGTYAAVAASWRDTTQSGLAATTTIGAYGANPQAGDNTPRAIVLTSDDATVDIEVPVDYSRAKVATGPTGSISGTLTLSGTWPGQQVYLVVLSSVGPSPTFPPTSQPKAMLLVPQFAGTRNFAIPNVPHGQYAMVGAYTFAPPFTFRFIGAYGVDTSTSDLTPTSVTIGPPGKVDVTGINFTIRP